MKMSEIPPNSDSQEPIPEPTPIVEPTAPAESVAPPEPTPVAPTSPFAGLGAGPTAEEKNFAMLAWFLSIIAGFVAPLIFFLISNDKPFVKRHAAMALGFQIVIVIAWFIAGALSMVLIGFLLFPVIGIASIVVGVMGGLAAKDGKTYDVPGLGPQIAKMFNV